MKMTAKLLALCMLLGTLAIAQDKPAAAADSKAPAAAGDKDKKDKKEKKTKKSKKEKKDDKSSGDKK